MRQPVFDRILPAFFYERIATVLLAEASHRGATVLTREDVIASADAPFLVVVAETFALLLQAEPVPQMSAYRVEILTEPVAIARFLRKIRSQVPVSRRPLIRAVLQQLTPLSAKEQMLPADLAIALMATLSEETTAQCQSCQPLVTAALNERQAQERLLHQVTTQIRQSLELPELLKTAVDRIREFLDVDRLLVGQFGETQGKLHGQITYESCRDGGIPSVLGLWDECWQWSALPSSSYQRLSHGEAIVVNDIQQFYAEVPCLQSFAARWQIKAWLIVPILVQEKLWGVLIAHQCDRPRQWHPQEIEFLTHLSQHLSIAIYQAQLYSELQQQKVTLEQRVNERTQALREALSAMEAAHRIKNDFLATMSHELRTPLTCVIGVSATLLRWPLGPLTAKQREYLEIIHESGTHLLELINNILDLSQAELGRSHLHPSAFSIRQLCTDCIEVVKPQAHRHQVNLHHQLMIPPSRDRFWGDYRRIQQILINLLSNAIKFTPAMGEVILRAWWKEDELIFQVQDNGIGIPAHLQPLLFQKFQQLDSSFGRAYTGAGLGLALTKQWVDLHHGWIEVDSTEGKGSTFTVGLPAIPSDPLPEPPKLKLDVPPLSTTDVLVEPEGRIVLVSEDEATATLICSILTTAGYQVIWLVDGEVERLLALTPIAVLLAEPFSYGDVQELVNQLRQRCTPEQLKIFILGSKGNDPRVDRYIPLPINPESFLQQVTMGLTSLAISAQ
ncbi:MULTISPECIES: hybrid sensor histidine kinase/response regulator [unclassified Thermosynechococcus]|uniref:hybrid sensor histidine kinase/response regulator n=1 Tax=unclassified Thermosynechococcus TaxID=2622553 RepID=UPI001A060A01|nr:MULTISPECIES: ATP-binding protein [unclassified Thermosynechococcus]HIK34552.1 GAF domain-containing protein [Thermosynechococcus sp. M98_K2018_005]HIK48070.1 GAF domain-containing protein [Thermosynechococcus sp. M55_K2018_012]